VAIESRSPNSGSAAFARAPGRHWPSAGAHPRCRVRVGRGSRAAPHSRLRRNYCNGRCNCGWTHKNHSTTETWWTRGNRTPRGRCVPPLSGCLTAMPHLGVSNVFQTNSGPALKPPLMFLAPQTDELRLERWRAASGNATARAPLGLRRTPDGSGKFFSFDDGYLIASNRSSKVQYDGLQYISEDCIAV
jgi:hypothetical protein